MFLCIANEIPHDQKIGRKSHVLDDPQLVADALTDYSPEVSVVTPSGARDHQLLQVGHRGVPVRHRKMGQENLVEIETYIGPLGHEQSVVTSAGESVVRKQCSQLASGLHVELLCVELEAVRFVDRGSGLDAEQHVMGFGFLAPGVMGIVGGQQGGADPVGDVHQVREDAVLGLQTVVVQLDEVSILPKDVLVHRGRFQGGVEIPHLTAVAFFSRCVRSQQLWDVAAQATGGGG